MDAVPDRITGFLKTLTITQGPEAGNPFEVLPWQSEFIAGAFAPDVNDAGLTVARGNGKTSLLAGIALATVAGPLRQARAETVIVAASFEQAALLFDTALAYGNPLMSPLYYRVLNSQNKRVIEHRPTGARCRVLASDPRRAHGIAPALILADEPAQVVRRVALNVGAPGHGSQKPREPMIRSRRAGAERDKA